MLLVILTVKKLLEQEKELRVEKVIKRKSDKLYVKWKDYDNSFNKGLSINASIFSKTEFFKSKCER